MNSDAEIYFSVDVETSGPIPGEYSLLTVGACAIKHPEAVFYCQMKPITMNADPEALKVTGLSLEELAIVGKKPEEAMQAFDQWIRHEGKKGIPVFVGLNAAFDWSFVNYYFHRFLGHNPFGFAALDLKSLFMGVMGCPWRDTRSSKMVEVLNPKRHSTHNAMEDALAQAELFELTLEKQKKSCSPI